MCNRTGSEICDKSIYLVMKLISYFNLLHLPTYSFNDTFPHLNVTLTGGDPIKSLLEQRVRVCDLTAKNSH